MSSSVVVVSYRPGTWLAECLASVLPQTREVIVVDNGSPGEEVSDIARRSGARAVRATRNLGFAGGVNLGLRHAHGEIVGLLNDDAVAGPGWLEAAGGVLADPTIAAVTPKVVLDRVFAEIVLDDDVWFTPPDPRPLGRLLRSVTVGDDELLDGLVGAGVYDRESAIVDGQPSVWRWTSGPVPFYVPLIDAALADTIRVNGEPVSVRALCTLINHAGNYLAPHGIAGDYGFAAPDDGRFDLRAERFGFSGTAPVFRSETLARLGGFATSFFAYNEDTDWCLRARLAGFRIVYDPGATVRHRLSATSGGAASEFVRFLAKRNALLCLVRNAPADVAGPHAWNAVRRSSDERVRRSFLKKLPGSVAARLWTSRRRRVSPHEVWDRWAGADSEWDTRPSRPALGDVADSGWRGDVGS